jgi:hypothetical protein
MWQSIWKTITELLWPHVRDVVSRLGKEMADWLVETFRDWTSRRNQSNAEAADTKAEQYERNAQAATSPNQAEVDTKVAAVWREVAEMFRQENEALAVELKRLRDEANRRSDESALRLTLDESIRKQIGQLPLNSGDSGRFKFRHQGEWYEVIGKYGKSGDEKFIVSKHMEGPGAAAAVRVIQASSELELSAALAQVYLELTPL